MHGWPGGLWLQCRPRQPPAPPPHRCAVPAHKASCESGLIDMSTRCASAMLGCTCAARTQLLTCRSARDALRHSSSHGCQQQASTRRHCHLGPCNIPLKGCSSVVRTGAAACLSTVVMRRRATKSWQDSCEGWQLAPQAGCPSERCPPGRKLLRCHGLQPQDPAEGRAVLPAARTRLPRSRCRPRPGLGGL